MKKLLLLLGMLWGGGACGVWYWTDQRSQSVSYRTVTIRRGDLRSTINATGTIEPEEVVDVGAQVAGRIESFGADPLNRASRSATARGSKGHGAGAARHRAFPGPGGPGAGPRRQSRRPTSSRPRPNSARPSANWTERKKLQCRDERIPPAGIRHRPGRTTSRPRRHWPSQRERASAWPKADLEEATVNLGYTTIRSPVKGIILDRRINIGQTVVASLNAPASS